jgi:hypothetical protein
MADTPLDDRQLPLPALAHITERKLLATDLMATSARAKP